MVADEEQLAAFEAGADARLAPYRVAARAFVVEMCCTHMSDQEMELDVQALALLLQSYEQRGFESGFEVVAQKKEEETP